MNASNLIKLEDVSDKERLKELELAANEGQVDKDTIFKIYQQIPFSLNELVNAKKYISNFSKQRRKTIDLSEIFTIRG